MPMTENVVRMTLFPRYTALYGSAPMYSAPFNVRRFAKGILTVWAGAGIGTPSPAVTVTLEQSADLGLWHTAGSVSPTPGTEKSEAVDLLDLEWARVKVQVVPDVGQPPGTTVWAVGAFVLREGVES